MTARHADPRSRSQRAADASRVAQQVRKLGDVDGARSYQRELLEHIRGRRRSIGAGLYDVTPLEQEAGFLLGVSGEILVPSGQPSARARRVLHAQGYADEPVTELDGRVTRFVQPGVPTRTTRQLARRLRDDGVEASVNYVVPLGYVAKGEGGFEPTAGAGVPGAPGTPSQGAVRVAVVDTGISAAVRGDGWLAHVPRDAPGNVDPLHMPAPDEQYLDYAAGHGEFTAGIVQQTCPTVDLRAYRAVGSDGIGDEIAVAAALLRAAQDGAAIINLSLGTNTDDDAEPVGLRTALELLAERHPEVLVVAAAGNVAGTRPVWPAAFRSVVAVAALTARLRPAAWSSRGPWVDCSTVGEGVLSTYVVGAESPQVHKDRADTFGEDAWALGTGTSFAAPQIAGRVAEELTADGRLTPRRALAKVLAAPRAQRVPGFGLATRVLPGT